MIMVNSIGLFEFVIIMMEKLISLISTTLNFEVLTEFVSHLTTSQWLEDEDVQAF
jgi:hypothetical protein